MDEKTITQDQVSVSVNNRPVSREPLFGAVLFGAMIMLVVGAIGLIVWGVYTGFSEHRSQEALPSIGMLKTEESSTIDTGTEEKREDAVMQKEEPVVQPSLTEEEIRKSKTTAIKVMNGGATKGSASVLAEVLKKAGYTQVTIGNTVKDYSGVVMYFAPEVEKEAMIVKDDLLKTYPKAETKPAVATNVETAQAPLSIILGK